MRTAKGYPGERGTLACVGLILGGTALFLAGHALFEWSVFGRPPYSYMIAIAALAVLVPVGFAIPALALSGAAALIVVGLAVWESIVFGGRVDTPTPVHYVRVSSLAVRSLGVLWFQHPFWVHHNAITTSSVGGTNKSSL